MHHINTLLLLFWSSRLIVTLTSTLIHISSYPEDPLPGHPLSYRPLSSPDHQRHGFNCAKHPASTPASMFHRSNSAATLTTHPCIPERSAAWLSPSQCIESRENPFFIIRTVMFVSAILTGYLLSS
ncbi:hypothetical protein BDY19DRAFT_86879 [Irpex rosettiformis]|uniref:Uncharacterized protein n=1 Tax=Irpex rosettiformis TaxID=378272 RepID=A0ACB8U6S3_9APHY|nr:hypothetical protein BDY19DRAFT_86879 [Irpex rosettiformis]